MKISGTPFFKTRLILLTPLFLWEKSEPPSFEKISKTETPLYRGGWVQLRG